MPSKLGFPTEAAGLDAIMLAPTRELVADLNRRARDHRLADDAPEPAKCELADGNQASVGDLIITRSNDRRLAPHRHRLGEERGPVDRHSPRPATVA